MVIAIFACRWRSGSAPSEGKARPHRWAPERGYVTALVNDEKTWNPSWNSSIHRMTISKPAREKRAASKILNTESFETRAVAAPLAYYAVLVTPA